MPCFGALIFCKKFKHLPTFEKAERLANGGVKLMAPCQEICSKLEWPYDRSNARLQRWFSEQTRTLVFRLLVRGSNRVCMGGMAKVPLAEGADHRSGHL